MTGHPAQINPLLQFVGVIDGQGKGLPVMSINSQSVISDSLLPNKAQKQRCFFCGYKSYNLWMFFYGVIFAIRVMTLH